MASISDLFLQVKALHDERVAWLMHNPPNGSVMKQVEELKKIGHLLLNAYTMAGGTKASEHEHVPGATPYYYYEGYRPGDERIESPAGPAERAISLHPAGRIDH